MLSFVPRPGVKHIELIVVAHGKALYICYIKKCITIISVMLMKLIVNNNANNTKSSLRH